jgi:two-component system CheB/CheR fusion protein
MSTRAEPELEALIAHLRSSRGFDFGQYKRSTLLRRFTRRMQTVGVDGYDEYLDYLQVHPDEFGRLFDTLLINVTEFFRDAEAWDVLAARVVPRILAGKGPDDPVRVWSAGCASGQEAYTLAMILTEAVGAEACRDRVKIYSTDVDDDALTRARQGLYDQKEVANVPAALLERYFEPAGASYAFRKDLRRSVIFGRHDLTSDPPISRLDLLVCRNTLMYFNVEAQARMIQRFHFALRDGGVLFLGKAETLLANVPAFVPMDPKSRIFMRADGDVPPPLAEPEPSASAQNPGPGELLLEAAWEASPVAQLALDRDGVLTAANGRARALLRLQRSDVGRPLRDLELSAQPVELRACIQRALTEGATVQAPETAGPFGDDGSTVRLAFAVTPLAADAGDPPGVVVTVHDVTDQRRLEGELGVANSQLETAYEELRSTNEELETTNEELQSTIEELETTNEELQSTNEELETMNEELQSTNEEVGSVNELLRARSQELDDVNGYLKSILTSLRAGVVVVDRDALVRVWNRSAEDLWGLRADEVQGKNFLNLDIGLPVGELRRPIQEVLGPGGSSGDVTLDAVNRRGRAFRCRVAITPLTADGGVRGAILLMEDAPA